MRKIFSDFCLIIVFMGTQKLKIVLIFRIFNGILLRYCCEKSLILNPTR